MPLQESACQSKRPVNLTLTTSTVEAARCFTSNLSATVDQLLADFAQREAQARIKRLALYESVAEAWNTIDDAVGIFGSEHSPL